MSDAMSKTLAIADADERTRDASLPTYSELAEVLSELLEHCSMIHKHWGDGSNTKQADAAIRTGRAFLARIPS